MLNAIASNAVFGCAVAVGTIVLGAVAVNVLTVSAAVAEHFFLQMLLMLYPEQSCMCYLYWILL